VASPRPRCALPAEDVGDPSGASSGTVVSRYCAAGHITFYPASVTLSGATRCGGRYVYLTLRWRVLGRPPPAGRTGRVSYDWLC
jgi:hypothetical protein